MILSATSYSTHKNQNQKLIFLLVNSFLSKILFEKSVNKPKESGIDPYFHRERPIFKQERKC